MTDSTNGVAALARRIGGLFGSTRQRIDELEARLAAVESTAEIRGMRYRGVWTAGQAYELDDTTTDRGSLWHCCRHTTDRPGDGQSWHLIVKRGRDGRDARTTP